MRDLAQRDIEIKLLRTLLAVVDEGGFARAAHALHVTQPAVSQQIRRLESIVRAPIIERANRPLELTCAGRQLVMHARQVVLLNGEILGRISALNEWNNLSLGWDADFSYGLQVMLTELVTQWPQTRFEIITGLSTELAQKVAEGELDAAVLLGTRTFRCEMLGKLSLRWYGNAPLLSDNTYPVALVDERSPLSMRALETLSAHNIRWRPISWSPDPLAVRAAAEAGLAYTVLPANAHHYHPSLCPAQTDAPTPGPAPLPLYLALSATLREPVVDIALMAARATLRDMP